VRAEFCQNRCEQAGFGGRQMPLGNQIENLRNTLVRLDVCVGLYPVF
jgi:hypothetical protein